MEEIAIISDIHGNLEALKEVLKDIESKNITKIYCLGDIVGKGIHSEECLNLIKNKCEIIIKGNWERFITKDKTKLKNKIDITRYEYLNKNISKENIEYIKNLPFFYDFYLSGRLIRLYHATPNDDTSPVFITNTIDEYFNQFKKSDKINETKTPDIVIYGHIHMQHIQKFYNRTLINVGSVGNSVDLFRNPNYDANEKNTTVANYLIIKGIYNSKNIENKISYELVSIPYNIDLELLNNKNNIEKEDYAKELKSGIYRNMEKIKKELNNENNI